MRPRNILAMTLPAVTLTVTVLLPAQDFWTIREPGQWSEPEIRKMVTDSPWAKEASVVVKGSEAATMAAGNGRVDGGVAGGVPGSAAIPQIAAPRIIVRWDSAMPVCDACAQGGLERPLFTCTSKLLYLSGLSKKFAELTKEFYIVSMTNYPNLFSWGRDAPQHSAAATAALERLGQQIQRTTFLKRKGKSPTKPTHVAVLPAGQALLVIVFFPRTETVTLDDKEVLFESDDEMMEVSSRFNLRKMVYKGNLEL